MRGGVASSWWRLNTSRAAGGRASGTRLAASASASPPAHAWSPAQPQRGRKGKGDRGGQGGGGSPGWKGTKADLPSKPCARCGRPFTWRKKWRNTWDDVLYCSERCRRSS